MKKIELGISGLTTINSSQFVIILGERNSFRRLPIVIGQAEANAIKISLDNFSTIRPMTHDLFVNTLSAFGIIINEIIITKEQDGIFYSELVCEQTATNTTIRIDSRTSDAIALAIRFKCKIFTYEKVLQKTAFNINDFKTTSQKKAIQRQIDILNMELKEAIAKEDYERASTIRDKIQTLKNQLKK